MFITNVLFKKAKTKYVMVFLKSTGSGHGKISFRERTGSKLEMIAFDPLIEMYCVYKEHRKLKGVKYINPSKDRNAHTYGIIPPELMAENV